MPQKIIINEFCEEFRSQVLKKPIIIYGLGEGAIFRYLNIARNKGTVLGFTDSSIHEKSNHTFCGLPIYSLSQVASMQAEINIAIATKNIKFIEEIADVMREWNINQNVFAYITKARSEYPLHRFNGSNTKPDKNKMKILLAQLADDESKRVLETLCRYRFTDSEIDIRNILCKTEEYYPEMLSLSNNETYIDCGAYYGDTILKFCNKTRNRYKKIIGFEADDVNFNIAQEYLSKKDIKKICLEHVAIYRHNGTISFFNTHGAGARVGVNGQKTVNSISLDSYLDGAEASFIKMDIEGSEWEALKGADKTIRTYHPKLAICVYHDNRDLWEIPYKLLKEIGGYKVYLRQYGSDLRVDTICYAIPE